MNDADRIKDLVAELRKLQDIIDSQADRILDLESTVNTSLDEVTFLSLPEFLSLAEMHERNLKFIPGYEVWFQGRWKWNEARQGWERAKNG